MRQAGRGTDEERGQGGKDRERTARRDGQTGGPQSLSLSRNQSSLQRIPFVDLSTTTGMGTGTLAGSGDSPKRSKVRATSPSC